MPSPNGKEIVFITGANSGLGFEITKALLARVDAYHILIGCRGSIDRASDAISKLEILFPTTDSTMEPLSIDISSDESIAAALRKIHHTLGYIDVLVNNAGADLDTAVESGRLSKREGWNQTWDVNVTGTHLLTEAFIPLLLASRSASPRLVFMTSGLSSLAEHGDGTSSHYSIPPAGWPKPKPTSYFLSYRASKCGLNMVAADWARILHHDGVKVFDISPGFLDTGLGDDRVSGQGKDKKGLGAIDPAIGGNFCADIVQGKRNDQAWPIKVLRRTMIQSW